MTTGSVDNQILDFPILAKLQLQHFLRDILSHSIHPDTLGGHTQSKPQTDALATNELSVSSTDSFQYRPNIHKLHKSIVWLLDVNFKNFTKLFESFVNFIRNDLNVLFEKKNNNRDGSDMTGPYLTGNVPNKESSGGFGVKF